ncbi:MAG: FHA domain-containing protein [Symploca sp. SIO2C1]|nr:FHA domain-containing protein [Symploca sp. SIO2C1]
MKLKSLSRQTGEYQEKVLIPQAGIRGECSIGRDPSCDLILNSPEVSGVHSRIIFHDGQYYFTDLGSTNGSRINSEEAKVNQNYVLKLDDIIRIGGFVLLLEEEESNDNGSRHKPQDDHAADLALTQLSQWTEDDLTVRCTQVIDETPDVKTFRFVAEPPVLFTYKPGQFVTLDLLINGKRVMRSYSISSTPSRPHTLEITVKRVPPPADTPDAPPGLVSNWLHDTIAVGSQIKLSAPMGKFTCLANPSKKLLLISAGSGITPMMSMSRWICDTATDIDVTFVHSVRSPRDIIFRQELELMAARYSNFKLAVTTTRLEPGQAWLGYMGRLNESMLQAIAPDFRDRTVYVCGPDSFMQGVKAMLESLDFPMQNYSEESFGSPKKSRKSSKAETKTKSASGGITPAPSTGFGIRSLIGKLQPSSNTDESVTNGHRAAASVISFPTSPVTSTFSEPVVVFTKSGKEVSCDGEDSILEVAKQEGVELPCGCGMGVCGKCKLRIEGNVKYDDGHPDPKFVSDSDREKGFVLTCVAKPSSGRVLIEA